MLEKCRTAKERWGGVSDIIDQWLEQRGQLIRSYVALPSCETNEALNSQIPQFCELLMDYLSSGHFDVYERIVNAWKEDAHLGTDKLHALFPLIKETTDSALDFYERYNDFSAPTLCETRKFINELETLGETLEERFRLEDQLIESLHRVQSTQPPEA